MKDFPFSEDIDAAGCRKLWGEVVIHAFRDALGTAGARNSMLPEVEKRRAQVWLTSMSDDFKNACYLAGFDPEFIRDAWINGRVTRENLVERGRKKVMEGAAT